MSDLRMIEVSEDLAERIMTASWFVYVCGEPDGQDCDSGTHPNICSHKCAAIRRFHASDGKEPGPVILRVRVRAVPQAEQQ